MTSRSEPNLRQPSRGASSAVARLRAQVIESARQQPAPTRAERSMRHRIVIAVVLVVPLLMFFAWGGVRAAPRPDKLVLETALGSSILAIGAATVVLGRGRSMLGRPRSWLLSVVLFTPILLFAWRLLVSSRYPDTTLEWAERPGLRCLLLSVVLSLSPLLGFLWIRRGSDPVHPGLTAAALGATAGASAWVLVDLWCPVGHVAHLLLGHVAPLVLITLIGALAGSRILMLARGSR